MLNQKEIAQLRKNAEVHKEVFKEIKKMIAPGVKTLDIDNKCAEICKARGVLCGFKGVYGFPANICISINDSVVHGYARVGQILKDGDVVKFDFGVKDKVYGVNTDAAFTMIIGEGPHNSRLVEMLEANKKALYAGIDKARVGNKVGDISAAIQKEIETPGFYVVKDLTGHAVGKTLHEKPYIPNHGKAGTGTPLKKGMVLAIEPIMGQTSGKIYDGGSWDLYIDDGSIGTQFEHTILITDGEAEIIV